MGEHTHKWVNWRENSANRRPRLPPKISAPFLWEEEGRRSGVGGYKGGKEVV
jgi:hypothetical protein